MTLALKQNSGKRERKQSEYIDKHKRKVILGRTKASSSYERRNVPSRRNPCAETL